MTYLMRIPPPMGPWLTVAAPKLASLVGPVGTVGVASRSHLATPSCRWW